MRILFLGGSGFLGKNLREVFLCRCSKIIHTDLSKDSNDPTSFDIRIDNLDAIKELIVKNSIDTVIHLISGILPSSNSNQFSQELISIIHPTMKVIDYCASENIKFIFVSSGGAVYGDVNTSPVKELHELRPKTFYGFSKQLIEEYIHLSHRVKNLRYLILRPSNPYGRHQKINGIQGFISVALVKAIRHETLEIWGDGTITRDYIDVTDLCYGIRSLIENDGAINKTFNIGSGVGYSINEVLELIRTVTGNSLTVLYKPTRHFDIKTVILDTNYLSSFVNWNPIDLPEGLERYYKMVRIENDL